MPKGYEDVRDDDRDPSRSRVVVFSQRGASRKVWEAAQHEFEDVIAAVDDARIIAPAGGDRSDLARLRRQGSNRLRRRAGRPRLAAMTPTELDGEADLFFAVFASGHDLAYLPRMRGWQERCRTKVAFVIEWWTTQVGSTTDYLRLLRDFDHVFVFSRGILPHIEEVAGVPAGYLPMAVDMTVFAPPVPAPVRNVDVTSYGRTMPETHKALVRGMEAGRLYYTHSTTSGVFSVADHREHRLQLASNLHRSRYSVVYRNNQHPARAVVTAGEESLTSRYFEGIAAGAVVLGTAPDVPDFTECFGWPDSVIPIAAPEPDIEAVIEALDSDPGRIERARRTNVAESLRRHDWAHRWSTVLGAAGLPPTAELTDRLLALSARADDVDAGTGDPRQEARSAPTV